MAFVKKRSPQEEAEGAQEVWEDLLATINPSYAFRDLRDVYVFSSSSESGVLITSGDEEGSIYHLDPTSLEVTFRLRAMDEYGTRTGRILGEKTSRGHYSYVIGDDGKAYRYEFASDLLAVRQTPYPVKYGYQSYYANTVQGDYPMCRARACRSCSARAAWWAFRTRTSRDSASPTVTR